MISAERVSAFQHIRKWVFVDLIHSIDVPQFSGFDTATAREEISDLLNEIVQIKKIDLTIAEQEDLLGDICAVLGLGAAADTAFSSNSGFLAPA
jgi:pilus assembly protein CpaF